MKIRHLFIVYLLTIFLLNTHCMGASLYIAPFMGGVDKDCVQEFSILLDMDEGDSGIAFETTLQSNMEFIGFEKSDIFEYALPYYKDDNGIHISLLNSHGGEIYKGGELGKVYYKATTDEDPYINFLFTENGEGSALWIGGVNVIKSVNGGNYNIKYEPVCENVVDIDSLPENQTIETFLQEYTDNEGLKDANINDNTKNNTIENNNRHFGITGTTIIIIFILILGIFMLLVINKKGKN